MTIPRIVIDARMVDPQMHGFSRYVSLLIRGLAARHAASALAYAPVILTAPGQSRFAQGFEVHEISTPFLSHLELTEIPRQLRRLRADLYHSPTFSSLWSSPCPWILTIHDLNHLRFGGWKQRLYYRFVLKRFARRATRLLSVSDFSRHEIAAWLGRDAQSIGIARNALDPVFAADTGNSTSPASTANVGQGVLWRLGLKPGSYFFCLSNDKPHKNVAMLEAAFLKYRASDAQSSLSLVNNLPIEEPAQSGIRRLGKLSDAEALVLYQGARAVFFPSLYEGLGLPPVEAAALGVPVVVSDIPAHREALAGLAEEEVLWLPADQESAWVRAFGRSSQSALEAPSVTSRKKLLAEYSVEQLAQSMDHFYQEALGRGKKDL